MVRRFEDRGRGRGLQQAQLLLAEAAGQAFWRRRLLDRGLDDKEELMKPRTRGKV